MKHFLVEIGEKSIKVHEQKKPLSTVHICANVDGERHVYQIKKKKYAKLRSGWFSRGSNHAYYHARNSGNYVTFTPVTPRKSSNKKEISTKQLEMF